MSNIIYKVKKMVDKRTLRKGKRRGFGKGNPPNVTKTKILLFLAENYPDGVKFDDIYDKFRKSENIRTKKPFYDHLKKLEEGLSPLQFVTKYNKEVTKYNKEKDKDKEDKEPIEDGLVIFDKKKYKYMINGTNQFIFEYITNFIFNNTPSLIPEFIKTPYIDDYYERYLKDELENLIEGWKENKNQLKECKEFILTSPLAFRLFSKLTIMQRMKDVKEVFKIKNMADLHKLFEHCFLLDKYLPYEIPKKRVYNQEKVKKEVIKESDKVK